jgi:hypothetical protein
MTKYSPLHQARLQPWKAQELKEHLAGIVDQIAEHETCLVLDVALELLSGELETLILFGRLGHLDPPRPDGKIVWGIMRRISEDPAVNESLTEAVRGWVDES